MGIPPEYVTVFDGDERVYLDLRDVPRVGQFLRLSSWSNGLNVGFNEGNRWFDAPDRWELGRADVRLLAAYPTLELSHPLARFAETIPAPIRDAIRPYRWCQFGLLKLARSCAAGAQLVVSAPNLAWLLVDAMWTAPLQRPQLEEVLSCNRRRLLESTIGVGTAAQLGLLGKIVVDQGRREELDLIRTALLCEKVMQAMRHRRVVTIDALALAWRFPKLGTGTLARRWNAKGGRWDEDLIGLLERMREASWLAATELDITRPINLLRACEGPRQVQSFIERWQRRVQRKQLQELMAATGGEPLPQVNGWGVMHGRHAEKHSGDVLSGPPRPVAELC